MRWGLKIFLYCRHYRVPWRFFFGVGEINLWELICVNIWLLEQNARRSWHGPGGRQTWEHQIIIIHIIYIYHHALTNLNCKVRIIVQRTSDNCCFSDWQHGVKTVSAFDITNQYIIAWQVQKFQPKALSRNGYNIYGWYNAIVRRTWKIPMLCCIFSGWLLIELIMTDLVWHLTKFNIEVLTSANFRVCACFSYKSTI